MTKNKSKKFRISVLIAVVFLLGIYSGLFICGEKETLKVVDASVTQVNLGDFFVDSENSIIMQLPAVDLNETGVTAYLEVIVKPGSGLVLSNIDNILTRYDTQESIRSAASIASLYTNKSLDNVDIIYNIVANASILEGPSAGAAFTVATVLALEGQMINDKVMMTGMINHDFTVGPAGRVKAKAMAAKESGAELFLVPVGGSYEYNETEYCSSYGIFDDYCQPEFVPVSIEEVVGIRVVEVRTLSEAVGYFRMG